MTTQLSRTELRRRLCVTTALAGGMLIASGAANAQSALPSNPNVVRGTVDFRVDGDATAPVNGSGTRLDVDLGSRNSIINWGSFNIGRVEPSTPNEVSFNGLLTGTRQAVLNRVLAGGGPSMIDGNLSSTSNVAVYLINPNGITFGLGANVNVGALIASTLDLQDDDDFTDAAGSTSEAANLRFVVAQANGTDLFIPVIVEGGTISTMLGDAGLNLGQLVLLGASVDVQGGNVTAGSDAAFIAGSDVQMISSAGSPLSFVIGQGTSVNAITVGGTVAGRNVTLALATPGDMMDSLLSVSGSVTATTASMSDRGVVLAAGVDATGVTTGSAATTGTATIQITEPINASDNDTPANVANVEIRALDTISGSGAITASDQVTIASTRGDISYTGAIQSGDDMSLSAAAGTVATGALTVGGDYSVTAQDFLTGSLAPDFGYGTTNDFTITDTAGGFSTGTRTAPGTLTINTLNGDVIVTGDLASTNESIVLTSGGGGGIQLNGNVTTGTGAGRNVTLTSSGTITQDAAAGITTNTLSGSAVGSAQLADSGNQITNLGAFSANGFTLADQGGLAVTGAVNGGAGGASISTSGDLVVNMAVSATDGPISLTTTGDGSDISLAAAVNAGTGTVALTANGAGSTIGQSADGVITAGTLMGSSGGATTLTAAPNQVTNLGAFNATGFAFSDAGGLTVTGAVSGGTGNVAITTSGDLTVSGAVSSTDGMIAFTATGDNSDIVLNAAVGAGTGTVNLQANGAGGTISQSSAGTVTAGTLTGSSNGATNLGAATNAITSLGAFTSNGFTLNDAGGLTVAGAVNGGAGGASITSSGDLQVNSAISATGPVSLTATGDGSGIGLAAAVNASTGTVTLTANGAGSTIGQTADGIITAGTLTGSSGGATTLTAASNRVAGLGSFSAAGFSLRNEVALTVSGAVSAGSGPLSLQVDAASLMVNANLSGSQVDLMATGIAQGNGSIVDAGAGTILLDANGGAIGLAGALTTTNASATAVRIIDASSATLGNITTGAAGTVTLGEANGDAIDGTIGQTAGTVITTGTLTGLAGGAVTLTNANQITNLGAFTAAGFALNDDGGLAVTGAVTGTTGIAITTSGGLTVNSGGSLATTDSAISLTTTADGILLNGAVNAGTGTVTLSSAGTIGQNADGIVTAGTLTGSANGAVNLFTAVNQVGTLATFNANGFLLRDGGGLIIGGGGVNGGAGGVTLETSGDLSVQAAIGAANAAISLSATGPGSDIALNAAVNAGTGAVTLSAGGDIGQNADGIVTAGTLTGSSGGTTNLAVATNQITSLDTFSSTGFALRDAGGLTVTGAVTGGGGGVSLDTSGDLTLNGAINAAGGTATLKAGGNIGQNGSGVVTAARLTGSSVGSTNLTGATNAIGTLGAFTTGSGFRLVNGMSLTLDDEVDAGTGDAVITVTGDLTMASTGAVAADGNIALTASGAIGAAAGATLTATDITLQAADFTGEILTDAVMQESDDLTITDAAGGLAIGPLSAQGMLTVLAQNGGLTVSGELRSISEDIALSTTGGGNIALNADLVTEADGGQVSLISSGAISQSLASSILTDILTGQSVGGASFNSPANAIGTLAGFTNSGSGGFSLVDSTALTVTGAVDAGPGALSIISDGLDFTGQTLTAGTDATLEASGGGLAGETVTAGGSLAASGASVEIGTATAAGGALSLTADSGQLTLGTGTAGTTATLAKNGGSGELQAATLASGGASSVTSSTNARLGTVSTTNGTISVMAASGEVTGTMGGSANLEAGSGTGDVSVAAGTLARLGAVTAGRDLSVTAGNSSTPLDGSIEIGSGSGRDIALAASGGTVTAGALSARDDIVIRADGSATAGALTSGAGGGTDESGVADSLAGATLVGNDISVVANGVVVGPVRANNAGGDVSLDGGASGIGNGAQDLDVGAVGNILLASDARGRDVALNAGGSIDTQAISARDDIAIRAAGAATLGALTSGATVDSLAATDVAGAADALLPTVDFTGHDIDVAANGLVLNGAVRADGADSDVRLSGGAGGLGDGSRDLNLAAGGNIAIGSARGIDVALSASGTVTAADIAARDDIVIRAGGSATTGALTSGDTVDALAPVDMAGAGDALAGAMLAGHDVDLSANGVIVGAVRATGAGSDIRIAGGAAGIGLDTQDIDFAAGQDIMLTGATRGRDVALNADGAVATAAVSARDDIVIRAAGAATTGALTSGASGGEEADGAADALAGAALAGNAVDGVAGSFDVASAAANNGALTLTAQDGGLTLGSGSAGGAATLTKEGASGELQVTTSLEAAGDIGIDSSTSARLGSLSAANGNITVDALSEVTGIGTDGRADLSASGADKDVTVAAGTLALLGTVDANDAITVTAGAIDISSAAAANGALSLTADSGRLTLGTGSSGGSSTLIKQGTTGALQVTTLTSGDHATMTSETAATLGTVTAANDITVSAATISAGMLTATDGLLALTAQNGALTLGTGAAGTTATLTKQGATGELQATMLAAGGDVTIDSATAVQLGDATSTGGNIVVDAVQAATASSLSAGTLIDVDAASIDIGTAEADASLTLLARSGQLTLGTGTAATTATLTKQGGIGQLELTTLTSGGNAAIASDTNAVMTTVTSNGGNITIDAAQSSQAGTLTADGLIDVDAATLNVGSADAGGSLTLLARTDQLTLGTGRAGTTATLRTTGGGGDVDVATSLTAEEAVTISSAGDASLGSVRSVNSTLAVTAAGAISADTAQAGTALSLLAQNGALTLGTGTAGTTADLTKQGGTGELQATSLTAGGGVNIASSTDARLGDVTSEGGSIVVSAAQEVTGVGSGGADLTAEDEDGDIDVTAGTLALLGTAAAGNDLRVETSGGRIDVTTATADTGLLALSATDGNIRLGTGSAAANADLTTSGSGGITLTSLTAGGDATITAVDALDAGTIQASGLIGATAAGANVGTASAGTSLSILARSGGLMLGTGTAGTMATLTKQGGVGQLELTTLTSGGNAAIASDTNAVTTTVTSNGGNITVDAAQSAQAGSLTAAGLIDVDAATLNVGSADAGGSLNLLAHAGQLTLGTGRAGTTATLTKQGGTGELQATALTAADDIGISSSTDARLGDVTSEGGDISIDAVDALEAVMLDANGLIDADAAAVSITTADAGASLTLLARSGGLTLGTGTAGTTATLTKQGATGQLEATTLTAGGGVTIDSATAVQLGDATSEGGNIVVDAVQAATASSLSAGALIDVDAASIDIGTAEADASLTLLARSGQLTLGTGTAGSDAMLTKEGASGTLQATTLTAGGTAMLASSTSARLGDVTSGGNLTITAAEQVTGIGEGARANLTAQADGSNIAVDTGTLARLNQVDARNDVRVTASNGAIDINAVRARGGLLALSATDGDILVGTGSAAGTSDLTTSGRGDVTVADSLISGGTITIGSANDVTIGLARSIGGDILIDAADAIRAATLDASGLIDGDGTSIDIDGAAAGGSLTLLARAGQLTLDTGTAGTTMSLTKQGDAGELQGATLDAGGDITVASSTDARLGTVKSTAGNVSVTAAGAVTGIGTGGRSDIAADGAGADVTINSGALARLGTVTANDSIGVTAASIDAVNAAAANGTLTMTASAGDLTLDTGSAGAAATLRTTGGNGDITVITSLISGGSATISSVDDATLGLVRTTGGSIAVTTADALQADTLEASAAIDIDSASAKVGTATAGTSLAVLARLGALTLGAGTVGTTATLTKEGGDGQLEATMLKAGGEVAITSSTNAVLGEVASTNASIAAGAAGLLHAGTLTAGVDINTGSGAANVGTATAGGNLAMSTRAGQLTLGTGAAGGSAALTKEGGDGELQVTNALTSGGDATIASATNVRAPSVVSRGGDIAVTAGGELTGVGEDARANLTAEADAKDVTVAAGTNVRVNEANAGNDLRVTAASGTIDITAATARTGLLALSATNGDIVLGTGNAAATSDLTTSGSGSINVVTSLTSGGDVALGSADDATLTLVQSTGGNVAITAADAVQAGTVTAAGSLTEMADSISNGNAGAGTTLAMTARAGQLTLGTGTAGSTATLTKQGSAGELQVTSLSSGGTATLSSSTNQRLGAIESRGGDALVTATNTITGLAAGADFAGGDLKADGRVQVRGGASGLIRLSDVSATKGDVDVQAGTAAGAASQVQILDNVSARTGYKVVAGSIALGGDSDAETQAAGGAVELTALSGGVTGGSGLALQSNSDGSGAEPVTVAANGASGNVTFAADTRILGGTANGGSNVTIDTVGRATLGQVTAAGRAITISSNDIELQGASASDLSPRVTATTVTITNRADVSGVTRLGNNAGTGGFAMSQAEVNRIGAQTVTIESGAQDVAIGDLALVAGVGSGRLNIQGLSRFDATGVVSAEGSAETRTIQIGGNAADQLTDAGIRQATIIRVAATPGAGGRLLMGGASLDLRGAKIGVGQDENFLAAIGLTPGGTPQSLDAVAQAYISNPNSTLYNAAVLYSDVQLLTANRLTVTYSDYALFQNTGIPFVPPSGVTIASLGANGMLDLFSSGNNAPNGFALFGVINGRSGNEAALLGPAVIRLTETNRNNTRINGCAVGSGGGGCIITAVGTPNVAVFDERQASILNTADDLELPFDPIVGTNNEALFTGISSIDEVMDEPEEPEEDCSANPDSPQCRDDPTAETAETASEDAQ